MVTNLTVIILTFLDLWFQPENSRFEACDRGSRTSWRAQLASMVPRMAGAQVLYCLVCEQAVHLGMSWKVDVHVSEFFYPVECNRAKKLTLEGSAWTGRLNVSSLSLFSFSKLNKVLDINGYTWWRVLIFLPQELQTRSDLSLTWVFVIRALCFYFSVKI